VSALHYVEFYRQCKSLYEGRLRTATIQVKLVVEDGENHDLPLCSNRFFDGNTNRPKTSSHHCLDILLENDLGVWIRNIDSLLPEWNF
jgi:hypothetical protein